MSWDRKWNFRHKAPELPERAQGGGKAAKIESPRCESEQRHLVVNSEPTLCGLGLLLSVNLRVFAFFINKVFLTLF